MHRWRRTLFLFLVRATEFPVTNTECLFFPFSLYAFSVATFGHFAVMCDVDIHTLTHSLTHMPHHCSVGHLLFRRQLDERRKRSATTNTQSLSSPSHCTRRRERVAFLLTHIHSHPYLIETTPSSCPLNNERYSIDNHSLFSLSLEQMPATSSTDRYSAVSSSSTSSSSASSTSSTYCHKSNPPHYSLSQSSTFLPLRSAASSFYLSKLAPADYRSMQSLKLQQQQQQQQHYSTHRTRPAPIARVSPRVVCQPLSSLPKRPSTEFRHRDENWLSCEELETIEKRFNDLLQEPPEKKSIDYEQRAKSCGRLAPDERDYKRTTSTSKLSYAYRDRPRISLDFSASQNRGEKRRATAWPFTADDLRDALATSIVSRYFHDALPYGHSQSRIFVSQHGHAGVRLALPVRSVHNHGRASG